MGSETAPIRRSRKTPNSPVVERNWQLQLSSLGNARRGLGIARAAIFGVLAGLMLAGCAGDVPVPFVNVALPPAGPGPAPDYPNVGVKPNSNTNEAPVMTEAERQAVEDQLKKLVSDREGTVKKRIDSSN